MAPSSLTPPQKFPFNAFSYVIENLVPKIRCSIDTFIPFDEGFLVGLRCRDGHIIITTSKKLAAEGCKPLGKIKEPKLWPGLEVYLCRHDDDTNYARTMIAELEIDEGGWTSKLHVFLETPVYEPELDVLKTAVQPSGAGESAGATTGEDGMEEEEWA